MRNLLLTALIVVGLFCLNSALHSTLSAGLAHRTATVNQIIDNS